MWVNLHARVSHTICYMHNAHITGPRYNCCKAFRASIHRSKVLHGREYCGTMLRINVNCLESSVQNGSCPQRISLQRYFFNKPRCLLSFRLLFFSHGGNFTNWKKSILNGRNEVTEVKGRSVLAMQEVRDSGGNSEDSEQTNKQTNSVALSPQANYTD
jgi:hypothetical protein